MRSSLRRIALTSLAVLAACVVASGCTRHAAQAAAAAASEPATALAAVPSPAPVAAPVQAADAQEPPVPLLWKVSDADNSLYLLGSFHLLKASDFPFSDDVDAAFADAEALLFEIAPVEMESAEIATYMARNAMREDGTRLDDVLPAATAERLQTWLQTRGAGLQATGMNATVLQMFEAWYVALMVTLHEMVGHGLDPQHGMDRVLANEAGSQDKPTDGLETAMDQIRFLDGMDHDEQIQMLDEALTIGTDAEAVEQLHAAWRNGDADLLWKEMALGMKQKYPQLYRRINVERNDNWVPKLEARLKAPGTDDTLVVVGALHLLGEDGVVEKLRSRGYQVERICSSCPSATR